MDATPSQRATLLITAGSAGIAFTIGFNLGAFGVIFFDQLLTIWVVATVILVFSIIGDTPPHTWPRRLVLLVPSLWLIAALVDNAIAFNQQEKIIFTVTVVVTMFVLPAVGWILITAINTDFANLPGRSKGVVIATIGLFIVIGGALGARNDLFLNCGDFKISGNDLPANCVEVTDEGL